MTVGMVRLRRYLTDRAVNTFVLVALIPFLFATGCAAKGPVNTARVAALTVGEAVLAIDEAEMTVYTAGTVPQYDRAAHDAVGGYILKALLAARGYERAVRALPITKDQSSIDAAHDALVQAFTDIEHALPALQPVRQPVLMALAAARAALAAGRVGWTLELPERFWVFLMRSSNGAAHWILSSGRSVPLAPPMPNWKHSTLD